MARWQGRHAIASAQEPHGEEPANLGQALVGGHGIWG
jgi:hypothetical protein